MKGFPKPAVLFAGVLLTTVAIVKVLVVDAPKRNAEHMAELLRKQEWALIYRSLTSTNIDPAWPEDGFVQFCRAYIEPNANFARVSVASVPVGVNGFSNYVVEVRSKKVKTPTALQIYLAMTMPNKPIQAGQLLIAPKWDYVVTIGSNSLVAIAARLKFPNAATASHNIDDPALYEFLLAEGDNMRKMGCKRLYKSPKKDDLDFQIDSIEEHARLYKTARNLVPIAAKYGRTMKYPPTASELAMK